MGSSSRPTTSTRPIRGGGIGGAVEQMMLEEKEFFRPDPLSLDGFTGSGADWLDRYKPYIEDGKTVVVSTHKVWGPQTNDLVLQLRKRHVNRIVLAGMLANLCVESHLRELIEQGFEVAVVKDATAAPRHPRARRRLQGRGRQLQLHRQRGPDHRRSGRARCVRLRDRFRSHPTSLRRFAPCLPRSPANCSVSSISFPGECIPASGPSMPRA